MNNLYIKGALAVSAMLFGAAQASADGCYMSSCDPENGSKVESLSLIKTQWEAPAGSENAPEFTNGDFSDFSKPKFGQTFPVYNKTKDLVANATMWKFSDWDAGTYPPPVYYNIELDKEITAAGEYNIVLPAGIFTTNGWGDPMPDLNEALVLTYTIEGGEAPVISLPAMTLKPEPGEVSLFSGVDIWFPDYEIAGDNPDCTEFCHIKVTDADGNVVKDGELKGITGLQLGDDFNQVLQIIGGSYNADNNLGYTITLSFPAGYILLDDTVECPAFELTWTIAKEQEGPVTPPSSEVTYNHDLKFATMNAAYQYPNVPSMFNIIATGGVNLDATVVPYLKNAEGETVATAYEVKDISALQAGYLIVKFNESDFQPLVSGKYTFVLPQGMVGNSEWASSNHSKGSANAEVTYTFDYGQDPSLGAVVGEDDGTPVEITQAELVKGETVYNLKETPSMPALPAEAKFYINSNKNAISKDIVVEVYDKTLEEHLANLWTFRTAMSSVTDIKTTNGKNEDGVFVVATGPYALKMYDDHVYEVRISFYRQYDGVPASERVQFGETVVYAVKGTSVSYKYSDVTIEKIVPDPDADEITDPDQKVEVTFSAPVDVTFTGAEANDDKTVWTLPATGAATATGQINLVFAATDAEGKRLTIDEFNPPYKHVWYRGQEGNRQLDITLACFLGGGEFNITPTGETVVSQLKDFKITHSSNIGVQGTGLFGNVLEAWLYNSDGEKVTKLDNTNYEGVMSGENQKEINMHLEESVSEPGVYTLVFPGCYFMTGKESNSVGSKPVSYIYEVNAETAGVGSVEVAEGDAVYYNLQGVKVQNPDKGVYVKLQGGKAVKVQR